MKNLISFVTGVLFAFGLGISGMTQTHVVRGFLDIFGQWDWRLMGVMIGAIGVHLITYRHITKLSSPFFESKFHVPTRKDIGVKLILGAALFGLGWGWAGICPGPGLVGLASGDANMTLFFISMLSGMVIYKQTERFM